MDIQEAIQKIEGHITKGQTEKALEALIAYTKANKSPVHEDAILLSGQFRQWKRENMLGVQQSGSELRRIEMSILSILKTTNQAIAQPAAPAPPPANLSRNNDTVAVAPKKSSNNSMAIIGVIGGLISILAVVWILMGKGEKPAAKDASLALTDTTQAVPSSIDPETTTTLTPQKEEEKEPPKSTSKPQTETTSNTKKTVEEEAPAATNTAPKTTTPTRTRTPSSVRNLANKVAEAIATVNCANRTYELTADNKIYDITSSRKTIGTSTKTLKCEDGILAATMLSHVYGGITLYYNVGENKWKEDIREAR